MSVDIPLDPAKVEDFLTIWQGSASLAEVAKRCGQSKATVSARAARLRKAYPAIKLYRSKAKLEVPDPEAAAAKLEVADYGLAGAEARLGLK
jgi:hypothetical protein